MVEEEGSMLSKSEEDEDLAEDPQRHVQGRLYELFTTHGLNGGVFLADEDHLNVVVREEDAERASELVEKNTAVLAGVPVTVMSSADALQQGVIGQSDVEAIAQGTYRDPGTSIDTA